MCGVNYFFLEEQYLPPGSHHGTMAWQGKANNIRVFRDACLVGASDEKLLEDHPDILAKYPQFGGLSVFQKKACTWRMKYLGKEEIGKPHLIGIIVDAGVGKMYFFTQRHLVQPKYSCLGIA